MGHAHQMVVHYYSEVISRNAIGFHDHKIIELVHAIGNITMNQIMEGYGTLGGILQAHGVAFAGSSASLGLLHGDIAAGAHITGGQLGSSLLFALLGQLLHGAEAVVSLALFHQLLAVFSINIQTLGLVVRTIIPSLFRALVPVDAKPVQAGDDLAHGVLLQALHISILDAQNQLATHFAGKQPVEQGGSRTTNM